MTCPALLVPSKKAMSSSCSWRATSFPMLRRLLRPTTLQGAIWTLRCQTSQVVGQKPFLSWWPTGSPLLLLMPSPASPRPTLRRMWHRGLWLLPTTTTPHPWSVRYRPIRAPQQVIMSPLSLHSRLPGWSRVRSGSTSWWVVNGASNSLAVLRCWTCPRMARSLYCCTKLTKRATSLPIPV